MSKLEKMDDAALDIEIARLETRLTEARKAYERAEKATTLAYNLYKKAVETRQVRKGNDLVSLLQTYIADGSVENNVGYQKLKELYPWQSSRKAYMLFWGMCRPENGQWVMSLLIDHDATKTDIAKLADQIEEILPHIAPWQDKDTRTGRAVPANMIGIKLFQFLGRDLTLVQQPDGVWCLQYANHRSPYKNLIEALTMGREPVKHEDIDDDRSIFDGDRYEH